MKLTSHQWVVIWNFLSTLCSRFKVILEHWVLVYDHIVAILVFFLFSQENLHVLLRLLIFLVIKLLLAHAVLHVRILSVWSLLRFRGRWLLLLADWIQHFRWVNIGMWFVLKLCSVLDSVRVRLLYLLLKSHLRMLLKRQAIGANEIRRWSHDLLGLILRIDRIGFRLLRVWHCVSVGQWSSLLRLGDKLTGYSGDSTMLLALIISRFLQAFRRWYYVCLLPIAVRILRCMTWLHIGITDSLRVVLAWDIRWAHWQLGSWRWILVLMNNLKWSLFLVSFEVHLISIVSCHVDESIFFPRLLIELLIDHVMVWSALTEINDFLRLKVADRLRIWIGYVYWRFFHIRIIVLVLSIIIWIDAVLFKLGSSMHDLLLCHLIDLAVSEFAIPWAVTRRRLLLVVPSMQVLLILHALLWDWLEGHNLALGWEDGRLHGILHILKHMEVFLADIDHLIAVFQALNSLHKFHQVLIISLLMAKNILKHLIGSAPFRSTSLGCPLGLIFIQW